jgi:2'-5' RNA ligase
MHWSEGARRPHSREGFPPPVGESVRAFIAIGLDSRVEEAIYRAIDELREIDESVRWTRRGGLHLTLKFLGAAVNPRALEPLAEALEAVAFSTSAFEIAAEGLGGFPNLERPRVLWAGVSSAQLGALAARVEAGAVHAGFARESRRWNGHLTIGRVRDGDRINDASRDRLKADASREFGRSKVESMTLYRSHLSEAGSRYEPMATFLLRRD